MNAAARTATVALILLLSAGAASQSLAEDLRPTGHSGPGLGSTVPRLGFAYQVMPGDGFRVVIVRPGTPAAQIGLEIGDVVLSINGLLLTHAGADLPARIEAARRGGWVRIGIREVRTGRVVFRSTNLFCPYQRIGQQRIPTDSAR